MKKQCENCINYLHTPNIIGGIAECLRDIKPLATFWNNEPCEYHEFTDEDKLKIQNDYYKLHLGGALEIKKRKS